MSTESENAAGLQIMKMMSVFVPLSTIAIIYFVATRVAELDSKLALIAGVVFGGMEWVALSGIVRKQENKNKTIG